MPRLTIPQELDQLVARIAANVGLPRVSFLIVRSSALSLASRKLFADLCSASLVFSCAFFGAI